MLLLPLDLAPDPIDYAPVVIVILLAVLAAVAAILIVRAVRKRR